MNIQFLPYPTLAQLEGNVLDPKDIDVVVLSSDDIADDFSNTNDFDWLKPIAQEKRIFMFGETHFARYITHLRNRCLFALNKFDYYPLLIMEYPYSLTPYINYYLNLKDNNIAERYFKETLSDFIYDYYAVLEENYNLWHHIRRWNIARPDKPIHVGFSDIEQSYHTTVDRVLMPYFQKVDSSFSVKIDKLGLIELKALIPQFKQLLQKARDKKIVGDFPFLTADFIETVIENLESMYKAGAEPADAILQEQQDYYVKMNQILGQVLSQDAYNFFYHRQKGIIRNLTHPRFLGKDLTKNKAMLWGGGGHLGSHIRYPDQWNFLREGSYLSLEFEPTKGKTYSIYISSLALSLGENKDLNIGMGGLYNFMIQQLKQRSSCGISDENGYYIISDQPTLDIFTKMLIAKAYEYNHQPMLIKSVIWDNILGQMKKQSSDEVYSSFQMEKNEIDGFDAWVVVPRSPVILLR